METNESQIPNSNQFQPQDVPTPSQESPASASFQNPRFEPYAYGIGIAPEEVPSHDSYMKDNAHYTRDEKGRRTSSPYGVPEPTQIHPAYFAPVDHSVMSPQFHQKPQHISSPPAQYLPSYTEPQPRKNQVNRASTLKSESDEIKEQDIPAPLHSPRIPTSSCPRAYQQPVFSPGSLAGPNGGNSDLHQPGQVAHPNMTFIGDKTEWNHGMCECSGDVGTCVTGVFCPCILDSRTAYRLNRRSEKKDSTDMLGFSNCNARCSVMSIFGVCGLCCKLLTLPFPHQTRGLT